MALFADRTAAGRELAAALASWRGRDALVAGIPRGGVVVAAEVARVLSLPLGVVIVRKLGAPGQEEFAVGAIAEDVRVLNAAPRREDAVSPARLAEVEAAERVELERRGRLFGAADDVRDRVVIVVDDGIATGATATAACRSLRARGAGRVILAAPVAPAEWEPGPDDVDGYVCPHRMRPFWAVGEFYDDFTQTSDAEVVGLLSHDPRD